jgi:Fe-coproporphyrin III synthase
VNLKISDLAKAPGMAAYVTLARMRRRNLRPSRPRYLVFAPTYRCNLKCTMCGVHQDPRFQGKSECSLDEFKQVFSDPGFQGLDLIRFTGGEPFLRKDFPQLVQFICRTCRPRSIYITTNATLTERIQELLDIFPFEGPTTLHLQLSIDAIGERQDAMRGVPGTHRRITETLELLRQYRSRVPFFSGINQTVIHGNLDQLQPVQELAKTYGLGYKFMVGCLYNENTDIDLDPLKVPIPFKAFGDFSREELERLYFTEYPRLRNRGGDWTFSRTDRTSLLWKLSEGYLFDGEINRLFHGIDRPKPACMTLFSYFRLRPDATLIPCNALNAVGGNLLETSLSSLWYSDRLKDLRRKVVQCRGCWVECDLGPSIYYSGDILRWILSRLLYPHSASRNPDKLP